MHGWYTDKNHHTFLILKIILVDKFCHFVTKKYHHNVVIISTQVQSGRSMRRSKRMGLDDPKDSKWTFYPSIHPDRPLLAEWSSTSTHDRPLWLRRPYIIVLNRPLRLKWPPCLAQDRPLLDGPSTFTPWDRPLWTWLIISVSIFNIIPVMPFHINNSCKEIL